MISEAIILAGGFGTRLSSVVSGIPKPMAPVNDLPFLVYLLEYLITQNVNRVIFSTGYLGESIGKYFGNKYKSLDLFYVQEDTPLGTGGAIKQAMKHCSSENVLVLNGDTYFPVDLNAMKAFHIGNNAGITIAVSEVNDSSRYGSVITDQKGRILKFSEKGNPGAGFINGGIYVISKQLKEFFPDKAQFSFENDFLKLRLNDLNLFAYVSGAYFIDIGIPEDYHRAAKELKLNDH